MSTDSATDPRGRWLTVANGLTSVRLAAAPACAAAILCSANLTAGLLFGLAVATDLADGRVARRRGEASALGGLLDHSTDASFVTLGLGAFAFLGVVPVLLPVLVASAFLQYTIDSRAIEGRPLRASLLGRLNGIAYFVLLGIPVVRDALRIGWPTDTLVNVLGWALVVTTVVSMSDRALAFRRPRRS